MRAKELAMRDPGTVWNGGNSQNDAYHDPGDSLRRDARFFTEVDVFLRVAVVYPAENGVDAVGRALQKP